MCSNPTNIALNRTHNGIKMSWRYLRTADRLITNNVSNIRIFKPNGTNITLFFAASIAAFCSIPRLTDVTESKIPVVSDNGTSDGNSSSSTKQKDSIPLSPGKECPRYGCPLLPRDMYFDEEAQAALKAIRSLHEQYGNRVSSTSSSSSSSSSTSTTSGTSTSTADDESTGSEAVLLLNHTKALELLKTAGGQDQATLTLVGYKGGSIEEQVNQDRAFVVSPFHIEDDDTSDSDSSSTSSSEVSKSCRIPKRLLGVFDGHSNLGELVSQYTVTHLPETLSSKLGPILSSSLSAAEESKQIQLAIVDTFVEIDRNAPAELSGGCTASIVFQIGQKIFVANAGDSRSFIATYTKSTGQVKIVYVTREDKPDLPEERARVERMGGQVYIPPPERYGASSRVLFVDKKTDRLNGLAMSRSIGDWDAGKLGVIPDPTVAALDIIELIKGSTTSDLDDVEVFAVSATDGLLDYVEVSNIARTIANSLYNEDGPHPLSACESLITTSATLWWKAKNGTYRDDIAIAVSKLSL